jgi:hypothetical protein
MRTALDASEPSACAMGEWHLPYIAATDREEIADGDLLRRISAARCARVSYLTHDGRRDLDEDLRLFADLVGATPPHASPPEHVATPLLEGASGNLRGWSQLRHLLLRA